MKSKNYKKELADARNRCFTQKLIQHDPLLGIHTFVGITDRMLTDIFLAYFRDDENISLVALGGYGREELCPYSDFDLLILHEGNHSHDQIGRLVRGLWDMGFPLGCVVRSIAECKKILGEDLVSDTSFLDARFISGNRDLFNRLIGQVVVPYFKKRQQWYCNETVNSIKLNLFAPEISIFSVEPDLKNGICTLRDCQKAIWSSRILAHKIHLSDANSLSSNTDLHNELSEEYCMLLKIRCALHMVSGRRIDILEFSIQKQVAEVLGFGYQNADCLMEHFFKTVRKIKQVLLVYVERYSIKRTNIEKMRIPLCGITVGEGMKILDGIVVPHGPVIPRGRDSVIWILEVYLLSFKYQAFPGTTMENRIRKICKSLSGQNWITSDVEIKLKELFQSKYSIGRILRSMYDTGFLEVLFPEFSSIVCKVEYDSYHEFTVDQHTLIAVSLIDELAKDQDTEIQHIFNSIDNLFALRIAVLFHDIGKSMEEDHTYTGTLIAMNICDRFGIDESDKDLIAFLIQNHLELSTLAFQREPEEQVIVSFSEKISDARKLDLLYLLTVVDIRSVGRKTWTVWKGMQLQAIYRRVRIYLKSKSIENEHYKLSSIYTNESSAHIHLLESINTSQDLKIKAEVFPGFERITVCGFDRKHFFSDIVACLSAESYNILSAQISTTKENKVLDIFHVEQENLTVLPVSRRVDNIYKNWERLINKKISSRELISERQLRYPVKKKRISEDKNTEIMISNNISRDFTVIELKTPDRFGLLYTVSNCLSSCEINIVYAKLSTRISRAIDIFYVTGIDLCKIESPDHQEKIKTELTRSLTNY